MKTEAVSGDSRAPRPPSRSLITHLLLLMGALLSLACSCDKESAPLGAVKSKEPPLHRARYEKAEPLLRLDVSAYHAQIRATGATISLLTSEAVYTLRRDQPPQRVALSVEGSVAMNDQRVVYYSKGSLRELKLGETQASELAKTGLVPYLLFASDEQVSWVAVGADQKHRLYSLRADYKTPIYESDGAIAGLVIRGEQIFFIEALNARSSALSPTGESARQEQKWTMKSIHIDGGAITEGPTWLGRTPAMLVAHDQLFFYQGQENKVYRVSADFAATSIAAHDLICSPLALADDLYCAHVAGVTQVSLDSGASTQLPIQPTGPITAIHYGAPGLLWVTDVGANKLELSLLALR